MNSIVSALNSGAWSGSFDAFEAAAKDLPEPVVISLRAGLGTARRKGDVLTGADAVALPQISDCWMSMPGDIEEHTDGADGPSPYRSRCLIAE